MLFITVFACLVGCMHASEDRGDSQTRTEGDKWSLYWDSQDLTESIHPTIKVQSVLAEGIGWKGTGSAQETSDHVIISIAGKDQDAGLVIPYASRSVRVKSVEPLECTIEQGQGGFDDCRLSPGRVRTFTTNALGRISFSVPLANQFKISGSKSHLPSLLIQADFMPKDQWTVAHIDSDIQHMLSQVTATQLKKLNPFISMDTASQSSKALRYLMSGATPRDPVRDLYRRDGSNRFVYDAERNHVHSYNVILSEDTALDHLLSRPLVFTQTKKQNATSSAWLDRVSQNPRFEKRLLHDLVARDDDSRWALLHDRELRLVTEDQKHGFTQSVVQTMHHAWEAVQLILLRIGLSLMRVYENIKRFFGLDDILRTNQFLGTFYRLLAPLGIRGLEIVKYRYRNMLANITDKTQTLFEDTISKLGAKDHTLAEMRQNADKLSRNAVTLNPDMSTHLLQNSTESTDLLNGNPMDADARTHFLHDRIVNNLNYAVIDASNSTSWQRIIQLAKDAASALEQAVSKDVLLTAHQHTLQFVKGTDFASMSVAKLLNFIRSIMVFTEQVGGHALEAIINILPLYWNLAVALMLTPIKIPWLYNFWTKRLTRGTSDLTILDMLTLAGSVYGTWTYKIFNSGKAPFTDADIAVFKSVKEPELFLYTWNHDPRTYAMDSAQLRRHRLGIYDWIPRLHMSVTGTLQVLAFDITLAIGGGNTGNPGKLTYIPQVFNAIVGIMGRIAGYPFTQLETNDAVEVRQSMLNPDSRFLGFWLFWIIEDVVRVIRPFTGAFGNEYPGYANLNLLIVGVPLTFYGVRVTYDTGKEVASNDWPRLAVLETQWVEIELLYMDLLLPYFEDTRKKMLLDDAAKSAFLQGIRLLKFWRDGMAIAMGLIRNTLMVGFHIVGMLSSSWQGGADNGDGRRPDNM